MEHDQEMLPAGADRLPSVSDRLDVIKNPVLRLHERRFAQTEDAQILVRPGGSRLLTSRWPLVKRLLPVPFFARFGRPPLAQRRFCTFDVVRATYYTDRVIRSYSDSKTRRLFKDGRRRGFRGLDYDRALLLLDALDAAPSLAPLRVLQAVRLHALKGDRRGRQAMTVSGRWRITFRFADGDAHEVAIEDYYGG